MIGNRCLIAARGYGDMSVEFARCSNIDIVIADAPAGEASRLRASLANR